jgi:hypothetical protein
MNRSIVTLSLWVSVVVLIVVMSPPTVGADENAKPKDSVREAERKAEQILMASHDYVTARSVKIEQTIEQTARVLVDGKPSGSAQAIKQTSRIEIDANKGVVRMTMKDQSGQDVVVIRKGSRIAMKIGSGLWTVPNGAYARIGDTLANPFACPLPKPGQEHSPRWTIVGDERQGGQEMTVIKTVGDTAIRYAHERMRDGIAGIFPDVSTRPTIEVMSYESRHWIGKADDRRQRVEQTSHHKMTMPGAAKTVIDVVGKTTSVYRRYNDIDIAVPEEAGKILEHAKSPRCTTRRPIDTAIRLGMPDSSWLSNCRPMR